MRFLHAYFDKTLDIAAICRHIADKYLETAVKAILLMGSVWFSLASLAYLTQTFAA